MTGLAVFAFTVAAVLALGFALLPAPLDRRRRRLALAQGQPVPDPASARKKSRRTPLRLRLADGRGGFLASLRLALQRAGLRITASGFVILCGLCASPLVLVLGLFGIPALLGVPVTLQVALIGGRMYLGACQRRYREAFAAELPNAIDAIVRGVRAGLPLQETARLVAREATEPLRSEFQRMLDQVALGQSLPEAVLALYERVPTPDVKFFAVVLSVQSQAGGNLSEALGNLSGVLRTRKRMENRVKALSSEARTSAVIIGSLPFAIGIIVSVTTPDYMAPLLTTGAGQVCLGVAGVLMGAGILVMRRLIRFEV